MPGEHDLLRNVRIFRDLEDPYLASLWQLITVREVSPKERIIVEGTPVTELCIVTDGVVHVRRLAGKREILLNRLGPGDFFGEVNLFDPGTATATVVAMKPTQVAVIPHRALLAWFEVNPAAGYRVVSGFMREMSRRFRHDEQPACQLRLLEAGRRGRRLSRRWRGGRAADHRLPAAQQLRREDRPRGRPCAARPRGYPRS